MKKIIQKILISFVIGSLFISCGSSEKELHIYSWGESIKPELIEKFETENQCTVFVDPFDSNESMYAKLKLGARGYDIIFPGNYMFEIMFKQEMLQPMDLTLLPNRKYLDPYFLKLFNQEHLEEYFVPYLIYNIGIGYRKDKVKNIMPTWAMFSREDLKGRMTMLNNIREALGAALKHLGYSLNTTDSKEIEEAANLLISWKSNLAKFESDLFDRGVASAEYLLVQGYSGDILRVMQESKNVDFLYPEEGMAITCDYIVIPKEAPQPELAHAFINFLLDPDIAAENMMYTFNLAPNKEAYNKLDKKWKNNPIFFPPKKILEKSEIIRNLDQETIKYNRAWDRVKAVAGK